MFVVALFTNLVAQSRFKIPEKHLASLLVMIRSPSVLSLTRVGVMGRGHVCAVHAVRRRKGDFFRFGRVFFLFFFCFLSLTLLSQMAPPWYTLIDAGRIDELRTLQFDVNENYVRGFAV